MILTEPTTKAVLEKPGGERVEAHFNPVSLQYTVTNTLKEEGKGNKRKQYITQSSAKLTMDLVFDTTGTGADVRDQTKKIATFMEPEEPASANSKKQTAAVVEFRWGVYTFRGMVESFKETIDYFSREGVPLRSSVNLTLARQDETFAPGGQAGASRNPSLSPDNLDAVDVPPSAASEAASQAGNPQGARDLGAANNQDSLRFPSGGGLTVPGQITLGAPAAFSAGASASAGAGFGVSAGAGISAGFGVSASASASGSFAAGAGFGASAGFSASAGFGASVTASAGIVGGASTSANFGASAAGGAVFGARASAGMSFSEGAFSGLRVQSNASFGASFDVAKVRTAVMPASPTAVYADGGRVSVQASAGLRAEVGASASLTARIRFEER